MKLACVLVHYHTPALLERAVASLRRELAEADADFELLVVDNGSDAAAAELLRSLPAKVLEARINGTPVEALCGFVWVPSRDPKQLPVCEECKGIYEMYRAMNDGLRDTPSD